MIEIAGLICYSLKKSKRNIAALMYLGNQPLEGEAFNAIILMEFLIGHQLASSHGGLRKDRTAY